MKLDLNFIRAQYPVFANPETARWAMFENAGGSYVPRQVSDRLHDFFRFTKVQPYGPFPSSIKAGEAMEAGYQAMAGLLGCDPYELTLGPSTSMNSYVLDLYLFSTYKTFGTHVGVMWGKPSVLDTLEPQGHYFNRDLPNYRFNPAGPLHAEIAALGIQNTDEGVVRISLVHYNTAQEVDRLVEGLKEL